MSTATKSSTSWKKVVSCILLSLVVALLIVLPSWLAIIDEAAFRINHVIYLSNKWVVVGLIFVSLSLFCLGEKKVITSSSLSFFIPVLLLTMLVFGFFVKMFQSMDLNYIEDRVSDELWSSVLSNNLKNNYSSVKELNQVTFPRSWEKSTSKIEATTQSGAYTCQKLTKLVANQKTPLYHLTVNGVDSQDAKSHCGYKNDLVFYLLPAGPM